MRLFTKSILGLAVLSVFFVSMPARAASLTSDQVNAVISLLQSFNVPSSTLTTVTAVLNHLPTPNAGQMGTSTPFGMLGHMGGSMGGRMMCLTLDRNLGIGSQGDDVKNLQEMLKQDPADGFTASTTGFFGPLTAKAMAYFQMHNGIASNTDGSVGPLTRAFFSRGCGGGLLGNHGPGVGSYASSTSQAGRPMIMLINGSITANNTSSITVQPKTGPSWTINILASTTIYVFTPPTTTSSSTTPTPPPPPTMGTSADLTVGDMVMVEGRTDGTDILDASTIRVGMPPMQQPMMGGGGGDQ